MIEWWNSLDVMMKVLWGITIAATLAFIIESILTFIGADADSSADGMDFDGDGSTGSNLLSFRNMVNFFLGFGWTAVLFRPNVGSITVLMLLAVIVGVLLVLAVMMIFKWMAGMQQSGTINVYKSAQGCRGLVYLRIPGHRAGEGKIQISINGAIREYSALTDGESIPTGAAIHVVDVISPSVLLVEPEDSAII